VQADLVDFSKFAKEIGNKGNNWMLVIVDLFTKYVCAFALKTKEAPEVLEKFESCFTMMGYPRILQTDNGGEFTAANSLEWYKSHGIEFRTSRSYRPQTQGQVERTNQTLERAIQADFITLQNFEWVKRLPQYVAGYNTMTCRSHGHTPYFAMFGREQHWTPDLAARSEARRNETASLLKARQNTSWNNYANVSVPDFSTEEYKKIDIGHLLSDETMMISWAKRESNVMMPNFLFERSLRNQINAVRPVT
jgi:hypothetical protein